MPRELISYFVDNANDSSTFKFNYLNNSERNSVDYLAVARAKNPSLIFPAPLYYDYHSQSWNSFYTKKPFKVLSSQINSYQNL